MKNRKALWILVGVLITSVLASACSIDLQREDDGSLTATTKINGESLERELELALSYAQSRITDVKIALRNGAVDATLERERQDDGHVDTLSFTMALSAADGGLVVTLSDVLINGEPADEELVAKMSERIAERLMRYKENHPRRSLQSVTVTPVEVTMVWHIETRYSQREG